MEAIDPSLLIRGKQSWRYGFAKNGRPLDEMHLMTSLRMRQGGGDRGRQISFGPLRQRPAICFVSARITASFQQARAEQQRGEIERCCGKCAMNRGHRTINVPGSPMHGGEFEPDLRMFRVCDSNLFKQAPREPDVANGSRLICFYSE